MKTRFLLFLTLMATSQFVGAQKADAKEMADYQTETMITELDLNEEQREKVSVINSKYSEKSADLMNAEGSMFGKIGDMKAINKAKNKELEKVLSEEQMEKYEDDVAPKMRKHMRKKMMG
ncbi:MAG: hypothetical protein Mars2KO_31860 [Maribacter sp.]